MQKFKGRYYKHQNGGRTLCLIAGETETERFIQVITEDFSVKVPFTAGNHFSEKGIVLDIQTPQLTLAGQIVYGRLSPVAYDIMGPFRFFPMECRHEVVSMRHHLTGSVCVNGEVIDFTGGIGYIEGDSGSSFPSSYAWVHANDFAVLCSIVVSVAKIPFAGLHFRGSVCAIQYGKREYRLATYLGVKVRVCTKHRIVLEQGVYRLDVRIENRNARSLAAPKDGQMTRTIREAVSCPAEFRFYVKGKKMFQLRSEYASFEYEAENRT